MGLKDWLQKKIKLPATKEEDEMATTSPSKIDFKKENSKGILSEESKNPSDENTLEASESESAGKEEGIAGAEELSSINQQRQQQSSLEEMKMQQQDVELRSLETEHSQSSQSMREGQQSSLAATSSVSRQSSDPIPKYKMILVPHDGSEISDKALNHAIYLSKVSDAEILILNVLDRIGGKDSSAVLATMRRGEGEPD
ncbi:MAG: universal stress protein, partial [Thermoproteota archaeon]|nr:universal stress protein [Thermoproteota archaeon]